MKTLRSARHSGGFTLVELLVVVSVIAILSAFTFSIFGNMRSRAQQAHCAHSLRQLGMATNMYLSDHELVFFAYLQATPEGRLWYFGREPAGRTGAEGERELDATEGPLFPYVQQVGGIEVCPSFPYESALWKPKYKKASWGYGFNTALSNMNVAALDRPQRVLLFGDCAQVNTFQAPATPKKPLVEEFYMIESKFKTIHFRHGTTANILFLDGHVEAMKMHPGTQDTRLREAKIGRITPVGSTEYLR